MRDEKKSRVEKKTNTKKPPAAPPRPPASGGSRTLAGRAFIMFMIGALMFTLGVFVGRGTAPVRFDIEKLQKELASLKADMVEKERQQANIYREVIDPKAELGFYEALKKTVAEPVPDDLLKPEKSTASVPAAAPPAPAPSSRKATPAPDTGSEAETEKPGPLTIQVASVKDAKAAEAMVQRLKKKGYPARKVLGKVPDKGIWYRIRIGSFQRRADTEGTLARLKKEGMNGIVVNH